jgi:transposase
VSTLFVGIDVSKDYASSQGLDREGKKLFYLEFSMDGEGFFRFLDRVKTHCGNLSEVAVAMESTGCHHINLFSFLSSEGIPCVVINPLLITNFARLSLRNTKRIRGTPSPLLSSYWLTRVPFLRSRFHRIVKISRTWPGSENL